MKVAYTEIYEQDPFEVSFAGKNGFFLAMGLLPDILNNPSRKHFEIKMNQRINRRLDNGSTEYTYIPIELKRCTAENFPSDYDYVKFGQNNWMCPNLNQTFLLKGKHQSEFFKFIQITVEKCVNSTTNDCAPFEETEKILKNNRIYMNFAFTNNIINLQDFKNPISSFIDSSAFFILDPLKYYKQADIFFQHNTITKDENLWYFQSTTTTEVTLESFREQSMDITSNRYAAFFFRSSLNRGNYLASCEKLTLMIARLGGLLSVMYSLVEILARFYNRRKLLISLANMLYNFLDSKETNSKRISSFDDHRIKKQALNFKVSKVNFVEIGAMKRVEVSPETFLASHHSPKIKIKKNENNQVKVVEKDLEQVAILSGLNGYLSKFKKIRFSWHQLLFECFNLKKGARQEYYLARKASKRINRDLDVIDLLQKNKENNKIKDFLFDDNQRTLFEFIHKPSISVSDSRKKEGKKRNSSITKDKKRSLTKILTSEYIKEIIMKRGEEFENESSIYIELYKAYTRILSGEKAGDLVNQKLISFLGIPLIKIFNQEKKIHSAQHLK
jgi:hypothetical protein